MNLHAKPQFRCGTSTARVSVLIETPDGRVLYRNWTPWPARIQIATSLIIVVVGVVLSVVAWERIAALT